MSEKDIKIPKIWYFYEEDKLSIQNQEDNPDE